MEDGGDIHAGSGEFRDPAMERHWRQEQAARELRQVRLLWGAALVFFGGYLPLEHLALGAGLAPALLWPRLGILLIGGAVLLLLRDHRLHRWRDLVTGCGLALAMTCYGALLAARGQHSAGALLLLVVGSYLFSPGRFLAHCVTGVAGSLGAIVASAGALPWLEASYLLPANVLAALALAQLNRERRRLYWQGLSLQREMARRRQLQRQFDQVHRQNRALLYNALPAAVVQQLRRQPGRRPARLHPEATLLFADVVDFSGLARRTSPRELLRLLDTLFSAFDALAEQHGVEKIKTIGDAYFAVAGLDSAVGPPRRAAALALDLRRAAATTGRQRGMPLRLRIGLHTGPVVAGVLGRTRYAFDVWGDAVNIASRLQSAAPAGGILVSETTRRACREAYRFGAPRPLQLKGCGRVVACPLYGVARPELPYDLGADGLG